MPTQVSDQALLLFLPALAGPGRARGSVGNDVGLPLGDALVDVAPGLLDRGERDPQLVRQLLIRATAERGQQNALLARPEAEPRRLVDEERGDPTTDLRERQLARQAED